MSQILDDVWQRLAANAICHAADQVMQTAQQVALAYGEPHAIFRPRLSIDGNQWCALYGDNLQDGAAGFGNSPANAMYDFDRAWHAKLGETK